MTARSHVNTPRAIAGVFVGGAGTRMGGVPKGLLRAPDGPAIVERSRSALAAAGVTEVVLVGQARVGMPPVVDVS